MNYALRENRNLLVITAGLGLLLATVFAWFYLCKSNEWDVSKNKMTLTIDSLTVVKNELKDDVWMLTKQLATERTTVDGLEAKLDNKNALLSRNIALLKSNDVVIKNAHKKLQALEESHKGNLAWLNNQIMELKGIKTLLSNQLNLLVEENTRLKGTNRFLTDKNTELEKTITTLKTDVIDIKYLATADNFRVDVIKANDKVTAKAKKANVLKVSLRIPKFMKSATTKTTTLFLNVVNEKSEPIAGWSKKVAVKDEIGKEINIAVHESQQIDFNKSPQRIAFEYKLIEKLNAGTYYAKVYSANNYLGTIEFNVRDSFWFF